MEHQEQSDIPVGHHRFYWTSTHY